MPELIEVELYRQLAELTVGRTVAAVFRPDAWYLKRGDPAVVVGHTIAAARRRGKLLLLDTEEGPTLGLRFGMTGRLLVDGGAVIAELEYGGRRDEPGWNRFGLAFTDGGDLVMNDPRRLGGVEVDPDEHALGPDAAGLTKGELRAALAASTAPLKARLLDQSRVAGLGNLLVDESLWRAGLDPARPAGGLDDRELGALVRNVRSTIADLTRRGGSHTGRLHLSRRRGSTCPKDGAPLQRRTIGGRTTYSCPHHQH